MTPAELEQLIETARSDRWTDLNLQDRQLTTLPENIGNLTNLFSLFLTNNQLTTLPASIGNLTNLVALSLTNNQINTFPESFENLTDLNWLSLENNQLSVLPENIGKLTNLTWLSLANNQIDAFPESIANLTNLIWLDLTNNPLVDLSLLQTLPSLTNVQFIGVNLPRRYWTKLDEWKAEWLLDENNAEIRRIIIEKIGYEQICEELNAVTLDRWREYVLLKIDNFEKEYNRRWLPVGVIPMVLLKMTCPSTNHVHILRVPPEMKSAEAAITWINYGIHPDRFAVQT